MRFIQLTQILSGHIYAHATWSSEPVTFLPVYVEPFYSGPKAAGAAPIHVNVGASFDQKLSSLKKEDILFIRDQLLKENSTVTPMSMFALSARLYDVGERDEAVFWFYAARDRYRITQAVGDSSILASALEACSAFNDLLGPFINGYAFCNIDKQIVAIKKAAEWTAKNPYQVLLNPKIPSPHSDRLKVMQVAVEDRIKQALKSEEYFKKDVNRLAIIKGRKENKMDEKFCW